MKLIVATNKLGYIGKEGKMMWRSSADFKHFKELTTGNGGNILIVGKTTFENDLKGNGLPGRQTYVVGSGYMTMLEAVREALCWQQRHYTTVGYDIDIWVIGGSSIYKQLMPLIKEIHLSIIDNEDIGDVKFEVPESYRGQVHKYYFNVNSK